MRALRVDMRLAVVILAGLSGCYGRYVGPGPCMPGMGGCYGVDGGYGGYAAGYGASADGCGPYLDGYGAYADYGLYGDCYAGYGDGLGGGVPAGYYGYDALPVRQAAHERVSLRERRLARRDARASRRDRRGPRPRRGRRSRGEIDCDSYYDCDDCADCGGCCCQSGRCGPSGPCGGCDSGPYVAYLIPMATSCGPCEPCGPWMECDPCCQDSVCCDGYGPGIVYDGMPSEWSEPCPPDSYPSPTCAGGSCGVEAGEWETTIPYSHEVPSAEPVPYPIKPRVKDEPYVPPSTMPPEGPFNRREGGKSVGIRSQGLTPARRPRLVPAAF